MNIIRKDDFPMHHFASISNPSISVLPESVLIAIHKTTNGIPANSQLQEAVRNTTSKIYENIIHNQRNGSNFTVRFNGYFIRSLTWREPEDTIISKTIAEPCRIPESEACKSSYHDLLLNALKAMGFKKIDKAQETYILQ